MTAPNSKVYNSIVDGTASTTESSPAEQVQRFFSDVTAALFDLDNTLIETHIDFPAMKQRTLALVAEQNMNVDSFRDLDILSIVEAATELLRARSSASDIATAFRNRAFQMLAEIEEAECANPVELPGARDFLERLHRRPIPIGIVTRNCRAVSERLIAQGGFACDALLAREDVVRTKPDPGHLREALAILAKLYPPAVSADRCVMVGDHWMDVAAGRAAGMRTVGLLRGRPASFFAPSLPDLLCQDMAELNSLVRPER